MTWSVGTFFLHQKVAGLTEGNWDSFLPSHLSPSHPKKKGGWVESSWGTYPDGGLGPQLECVWETANQCITFTLMFLSPPPFLSLKQSIKACARVT